MVETFEAREKKIGSIRIVKNPNFPSGTSLQAYIKTNRGELRKVFGNPNMGESGDGKSKGKEWNLVVGSHRVTIYDKREKDKKGTKYFNIGGSGKYGALLVAQALSIHRNERVYAKETVPQWLEDKRQFQQVKSIDEHPDLTYERAKEYEDNRGRYRAENLEAEDDYVDYTMWIYTKSTGGLFNGEWEDGESEEQVVKEWKELVQEAIDVNGDDLITADLRKHSNYDEEGVSQTTEFLFEYEHGEDNLDDFEAEDDLTFKEWADQEMMTHGDRESFDDWLNDELKSHGDDITLSDWGHHELDSHYERYGAESTNDLMDLKVGQEIKINGLMRGGEIPSQTKLRHHREWDSDGEYFPEYHQGYVDVPIADDGSISTDSQNALYYAVKYWVQPDLGDETDGYFFQFKARPMDEADGLWRGKPAYYPYKIRWGTLRWDKDQDRFFIDGLSDELSADGGYITSKSDEFFHEDGDTLEARAYEERGIYSITPLEKKSAEGFRAIAGKGFQITFSNGYKISVMFGAGNYADNKFNDPQEAYNNPPNEQNSKTAEIAVFNPDDEFVNLGGDDVLGYVSPDFVAALIPLVFIADEEGIRSLVSNRDAYEAENWGGNPKGKLALALQKAREKAKKPKKPLKIEKLGAEDNIKRFKVGEQYTHRYYHGYGFSDYEVMRRTDKSVWFSKVNPETGKVDSPLLVSRHKLHTMQPFEHDGEIIDGLEMVRLQMGYPVKAGQTTMSKYAETDPLWLEKLWHQHYKDMIANLESRNDLTEMDRVRLHHYKEMVKINADEYGAETSGQWEIGEQLEEAQMNAETSMKMFMVKEYPHTITKEQHDEIIKLLDEHDPNANIFYVRYGDTMRIMSPHGPLKASYLPTYSAESDQFPSMHYGDYDSDAQEKYQEFLDEWDGDDDPPSFEEWEKQLEEYERLLQEYEGTGEYERAMQEQLEEAQMNAEGSGRIDHEGGRMVAIDEVITVDYTWRTDPDDAEVDDYTVNEEVEGKIEREMHEGDSGYGYAYAYDDEMNTVDVSYNWDKTKEDGSEEIIKFWADEEKKKKKLSGVLSDPFDELSLDSGDWKGIVIGFGVGLLGLFGYSKLRK